MFVSATVCTELGSRPSASSVSAEPPLADVATTSVLSGPVGQQLRGRQLRGRDQAACPHPRRRDAAGVCRRSHAEQDHPLDVRRHHFRPWISVGQRLGESAAAPRACGTGRRRNRPASRWGPFVEQCGQCRIGHVHPSGQMPCRIDDLTQHLLRPKRMQRAGHVQVRMTQLRDPIRVRAEEGAADSLVDRRPTRRRRAACTCARRSRLCASDCAMPATSRAAGIGSIRSRRRKHRVAVEVGHHETSIAAQHLTYVQVAVSLDDRGACERAELAQDGLDLASPSTRNRDAGGITKSANGFQRCERGVAPPGRVVLRGNR